MPDPVTLQAIGRGAVVAPAGHGKTEVIAKVSALGRRALVLTHTHAGVQAIRSRTKRLGIRASTVAVDTIAGWAMRYAHAFPSIAKPPPDMPRNGAEWNQLYTGATAALSVRAVREVVAASYDRVLIDEYQDCNAEQHRLAIALSEIVPTLIFGDPMQGIFEFAGAALSWNDDIHQSFPFYGTLETPHRWAKTNPNLGAWIAEVREKLLRGQPIDLADPRITYRKADDAFDMAALFDGSDGKDGSFAAIHCNKMLCYNLARAANGGYQAIEEMAANTLMEFASDWDLATDGDDRQQAISSLLDLCFHKKGADAGGAFDPEDETARIAMEGLSPALADGTGAEAAVRIFGLARKRTSWKLFRGGLWRDAELALSELAAGRSATLYEAALRIRQRAGISGRRLPRRTVSTPLLLKGLEFDHVVVPDASHFGRESRAQAKLFYVAISRATSSLTVTASERFLHLPPPQV